MTPPQQDLEAGDFPGIKPVLRLIDQSKLIARDRVAKIVLQHPPISGSMPISDLLDRTELKPISYVLDRASRSHLSVLDQLHNGVRVASSPWLSLHIRRKMKAWL